MTKPTAQTVQAELVQLKKDNTKEHGALEKKVDDLQGQIKENRTFFTERLDRLDSRIWLIMVGTVSTLFTVLVTLVAGML
jgi:hypothetical protein|tara:strand:- start:168 stop:407 length:240 start_codon:yes stop_codon:yes gene_type:complete